MNKIQAGIIGLGVGEQHLAACSAHAACEVKTICDFDSAKLEEVRKKYPGVAATEEAGDILSDPDINLVCVASHDNHHATQIIQALEQEKHVFAEKPLCLSLDEAKQIACVLRSRPGLSLSSNVILRRSDRFMDLRRRIQAGELGTIYAIEAEYNYGRIHKLTDGWRGEIDFYSVFLGGGIHMVDLIRWLTGAEVERVTAMGNGLSTADTSFRHPDYVCALLQLNNGAHAKVSANFGCVRPHFHGLRVYGTHATFVNDCPDARLYRHRETEEPPESVQTDYPGCTKGELLDSFLDALTSQGHEPVDAREVFRSLAVCLAVEQALYSGNPEPVPAIFE